MNKQQRKQRTETLENLINAQQELILIYEETINVIDVSDVAFASIADPYDETLVGKNLHEIREEHIDREDELHQEISGYYDKLEGKDKPSSDVKTD